MKDTNLYITNLPKDITLQQIDNLFKEFGEIVQKTLLNDKYTGMPRGVAFVRYLHDIKKYSAIFLSLIDFLIKAGLYEKERYSHFMLSFFY